MHPLTSTEYLDNVLVFVLKVLYLETTRATTTTSTFEFSSIRSHIRLDSIVGVGIVDGNSVSKVSLRVARLRTTEQDSICSLRCFQSELVECHTFTSSGNDALSGILCEAEGAYRHLRALQHPNVVGYFSHNNSCLSIFIGHVLGKSVKAHRWLVYLTHVKALQDGRTELGVGSARQKLVKLDQEPVVRILGLHNLHGALMPRAATASLQINTHLT